MNEIKKLLEDKVRFSYAISCLILCIFAFLLLGKHDIGNSFKLDRLLTETHQNISLLENTTGYIEYLNRFNSQLTVSRGSNWLMETATTLAKAEGITLGVIKPLDTRIASGYKIVRITIEGSAAYPSIMRLLKKIENHEKYIAIEQAAIAVDKGRQEILSQNIMSPVPMGGRRPQGAESVTPANTRLAKFTLNVASTSPGI